MKAIWEILPWWLKAIGVAGLILFYTPWYLREQAISFVDARVHATIVPLKEKRDVEIITMKEDISEIKSDVKLLLLRSK